MYILHTAWQRQNLILGNVKSHLVSDKTLASRIDRLYVNSRTTPGYTLAFFLSSNSCDSILDARA